MSASVETIDRISASKAAGVGLFQVIAILFPGFSRSAATIMGGMRLGFSRPAATEFSFFLAIPAMFGASLIKTLKIVSILTPAGLPMFGVGLIVAFLVALVVIQGLVRFVAQHSFAPFAWYRIVFGILIIFIYWNKRSGF